MLYAKAEEGNATGLGLASELAKLSGYYALVGGAPRHTVVVVFVCLCVLFCSMLFSVTATN